jgi:hypothetical protein
MVRGIAVGIFAEPRYTKDLDILIKVDSLNVERLYQALKEYGAPLHLVSAEQFLRDDFIFFWRATMASRHPDLDSRSELRGSIPGSNPAPNWESRRLVYL